MQVTRSEYTIFAVCRILPNMSTHTHTHTRTYAHKHAHTHTHTYGRRALIVYFRRDVQVSPVMAAIRQQKARRKSHFKRARFSLQVARPGPRWGAGARAGGRRAIKHPPRQPITAPAKNNKRNPRPIFNSTKRGDTACPRRHIVALLLRAWLPYSVTELAEKRNLTDNFRLIFSLISTEMRPNRFRGSL